MHPKTRWYFIFLAILLISCQEAKLPAQITTTPTPLEETTVEISLPSPTTLSPTGTIAPTQTNLAPTAIPTQVPLLPIIYYYFVQIESHTYPAGSVEILPHELILGPALSDYPRSPDAVTNIRSALQALLDDPRNAWTSKHVGILSITLHEGAARVELEGDYFAPGDIVLIAARYQILLTVFTEETVQSAIITLNGNNIANLGSSGPGTPIPADHAYTRQERDAFLTKNAYPAP